MPAVAIATALVELAVGAPVGLADPLPIESAAVSEARDDQPQFDQDDVHAEALDLVAQRVGDRLDRVLGRVVETTAREDELPPIEEMFTIRPKPCSRIFGSTS